jgi:hypothetical protein
LDAWTGNGTASETWGITVVETPKVYFEVVKTAEQTIAVGGTDAALVTQATTGVVDGSTASATLSVFTVDTSAYELMFEGGSLSFTLTVSETGKVSKTVTVTLTVTPNLTGVAVFRVTRPGGDAGITADMTAAQAEAWARDGSLTRITGIHKWNQPTNIVDFQLAPGFWETGSAEGLLDALAWVDQNAQDGEEYLIRLEKNEPIPKIHLACNWRDNITIRFRGIGAERTITHNGSTLADSYGLHNPSLSPSWDSTASMYLFNIGGVGTSGSDYALVNLFLEQNVTITLAGVTLNDNLRGIANVRKAGSSVVMLNGSKLTGVVASSGSTGKFVIDARQGNDASSAASFFMFGGEITGNTVTEQGVIASRTVDTYAGSNKLFVKKGGSISGNINNSDGAPANKIYFNSTANIRTIQPGSIYIVPPSFNEGE